ncbi:hypothetical protein M8848_10005 [Pasteurella multocida]|uniref:Uncharacterized protein n=1 Tax=Pasteurella multocida TaxID=747 RepID=A0AAW8VAR3_PASMD|nr:hypothetical protein [Pasteurella multocida]MCL7790098.1 hypothetical protein [Pasteurella multocida]MCL7822623.1 hypothetical protein [Pasteurella multocida]MDH7436220.1 hypothetical protein [Pasteurella multocida]MDH7438329.1 hypothetical protein [Pasteurella multocida]MDH7438628.1 hypothetical protein [Pasteurella multocida]
MKKAFKYLLALPFMVLGAVVVLLYLLLELSVIFAIYVISFFITIIQFIFLGLWRWEEVKTNIFSKSMR